MEDFSQMEFVYCTSRTRCWIKSRKNVLLCWNLVGTEDLDLIWEPKGQYIFIYFDLYFWEIWSIKTGSGEKKSTDLTQFTRFNGDKCWLNYPQCQPISSLISLTWDVSDLLFYVWMTVGCSSPSLGTGATFVLKHAYYLDFPATPGEDVGLLKFKFKIPVCFYFNYLAKEQSTSCWKATVTEEIQCW